MVGGVAVRGNSIMIIVYIARLGYYAAGPFEYVREDDVSLDSIDGCFAVSSVGYVVNGGGCTLVEEVLPLCDCECPPMACAAVADGVAAPVGVA